MKKLSDYTVLKKGVVYNRVYVGENELYARINGKETFIVVATTPELKVEVLYNQFGSPYNDELRGGVTTFPRPDLAFKEFDLFEPSGEEEWFKKSVRVHSLGEALAQDLILLEEIADKRFSSDRFIPTNGGKGKFFGVHHCFSVEGKTKHPMLQSVFIVWKTWEEMHADFGKYGSSVAH